MNPTIKINYVKYHVRGHSLFNLTIVAFKKKNVKVIQVKNVLSRGISTKKIF